MKPACCNRLPLLFAAVAAAALVLHGCGEGGPAEPVSDERLEAVSIDLADRFGDLSVERGEGGQPLFRVPGDPPRLLTPEQFARAVERAKQDQAEHGLLFIIFNITTWWGVLWVSVGFLGQAMFTFRMVLQWLASEKQHKSVVPVGFWWGSLIGGAMLLAYFLWRKDIVGTIGQATGAFIYARNLWLIYFGNRGGSEATNRPRPSRGTPVETVFQATHTSPAETAPEAANSGS